MSSTGDTQWLELIGDYRCNQRCVGCFSVDDAGPSMSSREALEALALGRRAGADKLWLGGGDPTLRRDLFGLIDAARRLGYVQIKLQTNAMMLAYERFAVRCREAGVTEVALSLKGPDAETHERYTRAEGSFALLLKGLENARSVGLTLEGDVLVYRSTVPRLVETVREFHARGVARFRVWLLSSAAATEHERAALQREMPKITDVVQALEALHALRLSDDPTFVTSLHTPPCTLPGPLRAMRFDARGLRMRVVNPGGHAFRLEESPIEGGRYFDDCARCTLRGACGGARDEYVAVFGRGEFTAAT